MALQISKINLDSGLSVTNTYARIDTISGSKEGLGFSLNYYMDQDSFADGKAYLKQTNHNFTPSVDDGAPNYHKQGYEYLKTLPEFESAIDV